MRNALIRGTQLTSVAVLVLFLIAGIGRAQSWVATQVPISVSAQGRINAVAVYPGRDQFVAVGTESGGLYLSNDRGVSFRRVLGSLPNEIRDITWLQPDPLFPERLPNILLATTRHDYRLPNGGGLWRSTDYGESWSQVDLRSILRLPAPNDLDGYAISQDSNTDQVAVATSMGLALSTDRGVSWRVVSPFGPSASRACFAVAYHYRSILVAGQDGLRFSIDDGRTWNVPLTSMNGANADNYHGLVDGTKAGMAYYVDRETNLSYTIDYGQTWRRLSPPPIGYGGGIRFVYEVTRGSNLELYFSDTYKVSRLITRADRRPEEIDLSGAWTLLNTPHSDPRCMAFNRLREPYLLGTDGGLHTTDDRGSNWHARPIRGLEALQIYDVNGQWVGTGRDRRYDIYIGTQDNALRATDPDWRWPYEYGREGYFLQMRPDVPSGTPVITFTDLNPGFTTAGRYFTGARQTNGAVTFVTSPDPDLSVWAIQPRMLSSGRLIQPIGVGSRAKATLRSGLAVSDELEEKWSQFTAFPEPWSGLPFVSQGRSQVRVFEPYGAGWDETLHRNRLLFLSATTSSKSFNEVRPQYSRMEGFGSIGTTDFPFVWIPVFDVHPSDLRSLMAADIANGVVSQSTNGGNTWTPVRLLMDLVLDRGRYRFSTVDDASFVTAISYCPFNPLRILVGSRAGGAYVSHDGGVSWRRVIDSDRMANITSFHWKSDGEAYAATYGTGLWRVSVAVEIPVRAHTVTQQQNREGTIDQGDDITADGLQTPPYKGNAVLTFLGGSGDQFQPRYSYRETVQIRLVGLAPKSAKELEVFLDGKLLPTREYNLVANINQLRISAPVGRGGHILRVVWKRGQTSIETGGTFFIGWPESAQAK